MRALIFKTQHHECECACICESTTVFVVLVFPIPYPPFVCVCVRFCGSFFFLGWVILPPSHRCEGNVLGDELRIGDPVIPVHRSILIGRTLFCYFLTKGMCMCLCVCAVGWALCFIFAVGLHVGKRYIKTKDEALAYIWFVLI